MRKLAAETTWADVASEFTIKAVVLKITSSAGNVESRSTVFFSLKCFTFCI